MPYRAVYLNAYSGMRNANIDYDQQVHPVVLLQYFICTVQFRVYDMISSIHELLYIHVKHGIHNVHIWEPLCKPKAIVWNAFNVCKALL